ncbi:MAG: CHASE3 domain-containing protein [Pseudomonadota bacterium]
MTRPLDTALANLPTRRKIILAVAVPLVFTVFVGAVAIVKGAQNKHAHDWVDHTQRVLAQTSNIVAAAVDMETGMRGYLLAGQEEFLDPYKEGSGRAFTQLEDLRQTVSDNPPQVARLEEAEAQLRAWQSEVAETQIALRRAIGDAPTMNDMAAIVKTGEGKAFFDAFRSLIDRFIDAEQTLLAQRQARFDELLASGRVTGPQAREAIDWVTHTYRVIGEANLILAAAIDMETGMRGFLLAGDDAFLEPYEAGLASFSDRVDALAQTVSDNPQQVALLDEVRDVIDNWNTETVGPILALRREIGDAATMDNMADLVGEARGKAFFDAFRATMADFAAVEEALMLERRAANDALSLNTIFIIAGSVLVSLLLGGFVARRIGNDIGQAVLKLTDGMGKLAAGDNATIIEGQDRKDEIGEMSRATEVFKQNAIRIEALNEERAADAKRLADMAEGREAAAKKEAQLAKERERADRDARERLDAMMTELDGVVDGALDGEFDRRLPTAFADESLDGLAIKVNRLLEVVDTGLTETGTMLGKVASGDLLDDMEGDFRGAFARLQRDVNGMIGALRTVIGDIGAASDSVTGSSAELSATAADLSKETERNAAALEETSAAVEEVSSSVKQISSNVAESSADARQARETAQANEVVATEAVSSMERISEASQEISRVVGVIESIAFQINLLALNAGVEAARAGEAGRGFSVVASEVRALAQRSSEAASEITDVIARSDTAVAEGVKKVSAAKSSLDEIAGIVIRIAGSIDDASTMISEQSTGIAEISTAISQLDNATQKQAAAFEEITASSAVLADQANTMRSSIAQFRTHQTDGPSGSSQYAAPNADAEEDSARPNAA